MEDTKQIRKEMKKELGYNARQVSVKGDHGSITFTIRDENVDASKVREFATTYENITRDEITNAILRGGNTFVNVYFSEKLTAEFSKRHEEEIKKIIESIDGDYMLGFGDWIIGKDNEYGNFEAVLKEDNFIRVHGVNYAHLSEGICKHGGKEKISLVIPEITEEIEFAGNKMTLI